VGLSSAGDERWPDARRGGSRLTEQFYFTTIAGIALSAAGFAGLITALRGDGPWSKTELWRLRSIVRSALTLVVVSLLPEPIFRAVGGDEPLTIRVTSAVIALVLASFIQRAIADRREWPGFAREAGLIVGGQLVIQLVNIYLASLALLMLGLLGLLLGTLQVFMRVIRDFRPPGRED
jgi:hypothetical protein